MRFERRDWMDSQGGQQCGQAANSGGGPAKTGPRALGISGERDAKKKIQWQVCCGFPLEQAWPPG